MDNNLKITIKDVLFKTCNNVYIGRLFKEPLYDSEKYENILIQNIIYKYFEKIDNSLTKGHTFDNYPSYNPKIRKQDTVILDNLFFKENDNRLLNGEVMVVTVNAAALDDFINIKHRYHFDDGEFTLINSPSDNPNSQIWFCFEINYRTHF